MFIRKGRRFILIVLGVLILVIAIAVGLSMREATAFYRKITLGNDILRVSKNGYVVNVDYCLLLKHQNKSLCYFLPYGFIKNSYLDSGYLISQLKPDFVLPEFPVSTVSQVHSTNKTILQPVSLSINFFKHQINLTYIKTPDSAIYNSNEAIKFLKHTVLPFYKNEFYPALTSSPYLILSCNINGCGSYYPNLIPQIYNWKNDLTLINYGINTNADPYFDYCYLVAGILNVKNIEPKGSTYTYKNILDTNPILLSCMYNQVYMSKTIFYDYNKLQLARLLYTNIYLTPYKIRYPIVVYDFNTGLLDSKDSKYLVIQKPFASLWYYYLISYIVNKD